MFSGRKKRLGLLKTPKRDPKRLAEETAASQSSDEKDRMKLAKNEDTHREILYYLAENDPSDAVREAVAKNLMTPLQASEIISKDKQVDVRLALIKRLTYLLPDLSDDEYSQLYAHAVQALSNLALDEVIKVRRALSSALKDKAYTPPQVAAQLAKDLEREVSEPILKFCTAVPDDTLIDIIRATKHEWALLAIAERDKINEDVAGAVVDRKDMPQATQTMLGNTGAKLSRDTMDYIIREAQNHPEWQSPLAERKNLPADMISQIASFVSKKIRKKMLKNSGFDKETQNEIEKTAERRIAFLTDENGKPVSALDKLNMLIKRAELDEEQVMDALGLGEREFVVHALSFMGEVDVPIVKRIISTKAPKPLVALCWQAGLSMRSALTIQQDLAKIQPDELLYPKGGSKYPLDKKTMIFQLEFFKE